MSDSDEDAPVLSQQALAALQEFYVEQAEQEEKLNEAYTGKVDGYVPEENWQLSQFWYEEDTATRLAQEALNVAGKEGRIVCISAPTAYRKLREIKPETCTAKILEFDDRFKIYGEDFQFYDYSTPLKVPQEWKSSFDIVVVDPPFLNEDCLCKTAVTVKFLAKEKIILCTGAVMQESAERLLGVKECKFQPRHSNQLQNEFRCYTNYHSHLLNDV